MTNFIPELDFTLIGGSIEMYSFDHGLRMPNEAFFIEIQNFWAWADKLGRVNCGVFWSKLSTPILVQ